MPLHDHFRGDLAWRPWESFQSQWCGSIAADLNRTLPKRFVADAPVHLGVAIAPDVAEFEKLCGHENDNGVNGSTNGGVAVAAPPHAPTQTQAVSYSPPATDLTLPAEFPPEMLIQVKDTTRQYRVVAVVEMVSPGNKDREEYRDQFAAKCLSYLAVGIGLVVIDVVTCDHFNLHNEVVRLAGHDAKFEMAGDPPVYVAAYRPVHRNKADQIDLWHWPLAVGSPLPAVPLALKGFGCVRLDLEATYAEACERTRIP